MQQSIKTLSVIALASALLTACATSDSTGGTALQRSAAGKIQACKSGDTQVASASQCLQDDAACYQMAGGQWCTGERGNTCPAGSSPLPANAACPPGARCFDFSDSLRCAIQIK